MAHPATGDGGELHVPARQIASWCSSHVRGREEHTCISRPTLDLFFWAVDAPVSWFATLELVSALLQPLWQPLSCDEACIEGSEWTTQGCGTRASPADCTAAGDCTAATAAVAQAGSGPQSGPTESLVGGPGDAPICGRESRLRSVGCQAGFKRDTRHGFPSANTPLQRHYQC